MNYEAVMRLIGRLSGTLQFFPSDTEARIGIAEEIAEMASDEEQVRWLVKRLPQLYQKWPAILEVRAVFCSKLRPKDKLEAYSSVYIDGIPSEKEALPALAAAPTRQLAAGEPVSIHPSINAAVGDLCRKTDLNRALKGIPAKVREIPVVNVTEGNRITEADFKTAAEVYRNRKAAEECGLAASLPGDKKVAI